MKFTLLGRRLPEFGERMLMRWICPAVLLLSCTTPAEHTNPLDPESPHYSTQGSIVGRVTTFYPPFRDLSNVIVELQPAGIFSSSDMVGRFAFLSLAHGSYSLTVSAPGYAQEIVAAEVLPRRTTELEVRLNALPAADSAWAISAHVATRETATDRFFLEINSEVQDPDGAADVRSVSVEILAFAFRDTLNRADTPTHWHRLFAQEDMGGLAISNLAGVPLHLIMQDAPGERVISSPFYLARVIEQVPEPLGPANGEIIDDRTPTLIWALPPITFAHTLRVEVFRLDAGFPTFLAAIGKIAAGSTSVTYLSSLSNGTYFWTVRIVDAFGNYSRSKEAIFQVQR